MLTHKEAKAILESMLEPLRADPNPDWKESLGDAADLLSEVMVDAGVDDLEKQSMDGGE